MYLFFKKHRLYSSDKDGLEKNNKQIQIQRHSRYQAPNYNGMPNIWGVVFETTSLF